MYSVLEQYWDGGEQQCGREVYRGGVYRVGTRVGNTGVQHQGPDIAKGADPDSEAGPGSPRGAGVGGLGLRNTPGPPTQPPTLRARSVPAGPPWWLGGLFTASGPIRARFDLISQEVSQNGQVSPEKRKKACHSPYIQNGLEISPLDFLRFPFWPAFSHKELLVPF